MINLQYSQFISKMDVVGNIIDHGTNVYMPERPDHFEDDGQARHTFLAMTGADIKGFDTDREVFLGPYRTYATRSWSKKGAAGIQNLSATMDAALCRLMSSCSRGIEGIGRPHGHRQGRH